jgi:hypothetical protein
VPVEQLSLDGKGALEFPEPLFSGHLKLQTPV